MFNNKCLIEINKKIKELSFDMEILKINVVFKYVENKWKFHSFFWQCCDNNCVNNNNPNGLCSKGNGFPQIKSNTKIEYINCKENGSDLVTRIQSENYFIKPIDELIKTFTLYYYEVKLISEEIDWIFIGFRNRNDNIDLDLRFNAIHYFFRNKSKRIKLPSLTYKTNDIIGCGLVYPPPKIKNKLLPYIFFTQNGKQIGKAILLKEDCESFRPFVSLRCCSIETNFGDKSFNYDLSKYCDKIYYIRDLFK
ncbi:hypothetical protein Mgra_00006316 [Meloidogyne graminicola]|uniref:SPRY domain-containing protein n=1 Tax=Meloidogyne graminicola TaxID=189291 RepID=A0A8S9ZLF5_9BILA|nr:hypothetical protein Mgra_00006316 [Meloidogyne graminicola]